ncbi:MAG: hypothetical protein J3K34DRAFT_470712 [Monoraphidium minutum]|nr:MAG: hypothetical protein J3K34DRAFT_470712 [Monoraphidium minutum]
MAHGHSGLPEMDTLAMTDAELEDFLSFMDQPQGAATAGAVAMGGLHSGPLAAFAAAEPSDEAGTGDARAAAAHTSSSDAHGSSEQHDSRMVVDASEQRSPGSDEDCTAPAGARHPQHAQHPQHRAAGAPAAQPMAIGGAPPHAHAYMHAAPVPVPVPAPRAASFGAAGSGAARPEMLRAHSVASLGSLTMPLEGLALGSPAVGTLSAADGGGGGGGAPQMVMFSAAPHGHMSAFGTAFAAGGMPVVGMGAFGTAGVAFVPAGQLAACGSAPPGMHGVPSLASTLGGGGIGCGDGGGDGQQLSTSWPASAPAGDGGSGGGLQRQRSGGAPRPPSSGRGAGAARGRGSAGGGAADATYHRSSGGGGTLSHSTIEKQRRDRLNGLLDELGAMVPPSDGRTDAARRPKHVILSDAIALLTSLQERLRLGGDEVAALRQRLAAAEGGGGAAGIDIAPGGGGGGAPGAPVVKPEPSSSVGERGLIPPTPSGTSPADAPPGMLRHASSEAELPAAAGGGAPGGAPPSVVVEQEGGCVRVAVSCHDREGLLSDLAAAVKATGARIAKASISTTGDGSARDDFELRLEEGGPAGLEAVRHAVLGVLSGAGAPAAPGARGKRTRL